MDDATRTLPAGPFRNLEDILTLAAVAGASQVHVADDRPVLARIDGRLVPLTSGTIPHDSVSDFARRLNGMTSSDRAMLGGFHEVTVTTDAGRTLYDVMVRRDDSCFMGHAITASLRSDAPPVPLNQHGLPEEATAPLRARGGLVLVCGTEGTARDGLLWSMLRHLVEDTEVDRVAVRVATIPDLTLAEVTSPTTILTQVAVGRGGGIAADHDVHLPAFLRHALHGAPDAVFLQEIPGPASLAAACRLALRGTLVAVGLNVPDVPSAFRWLSANLPEEGGRALAHDVVEALSLVVARRVLPRKGGGDVGLHSYAVVGEGERDGWHRTPATEWHAAAVAMMRKGSGVIRRDYAEDAARLMRDGTIDAVTFEHVAHV